MRRSHRFFVPVLALLLAGGSGSATATEQTAPSGSPPAAPQSNRQADNASVTEPTAAAPSEAASGLAQEIGERLAIADGKLSAADRADREALGKFYAGRGNEPVWAKQAGLSPTAKAIVGEIKRADEWGLEASAFRLPNPSSSASLSRAEQVDADVTLSLAILKYARYARGGRLEPASLSSYLDRRPTLPDPQQVMERIASAAEPDAYLRDLHPRHPQFTRLRQQYLALKREQPVAQPDAQAAHDGGKARGKKAAAPPELPSARKLLANMEQWRWMPEDLGEFYVWVNIPEFTLRVVKHGKVVHAERVVVGKTDTQTPIFSDAMEQVIFHPFWGVPDSIKRNEIHPSLARGGTSILARHNLRVQYRGRDVDPDSVDWSSVDIRNFHVYQPPGGGNVLGVVKFRFPNKHDVYMHDTPSKSLFNASVRAFSHGCMRVRNPDKLAELLLAEDKGWPAGRVAAAIQSGQQDNQINLAQRFPVHVTYFTAAVDDDGKLKLFGDLYGHEQRISLGLEGKAHLIPRLVPDPKPVRPEAVSGLAEIRGASAKKDWIRRVFEN